MTTIVEKQELCPICAMKLPIIVTEGSVVKFFCRSMRCEGVWRTIDRRIPVLVG